jgi:hypothetical protein
MRKKRATIGPMALLRTQGKLPEQTRCELAYAKQRPADLSQAAPPGERGETTAETGRTATEEAYWALSLGAAQGPEFGRLYSPRRSSAPKDQAQAQEKRMPLKVGLYKVVFHTPRGTGAGVVQLTGGKIRGGDSALYYTGIYEQNGNQFAGSVSTARHSPGIPSVFGKDEVSITFTGNSTENHGTLQGSSPQAPGVTFHAVLTRLGD